MVAYKYSILGGIEINTNKEIHTITKEQLYLTVLLTFIESTNNGTMFWSDLEAKLGNIFWKILPKEILKVAIKENLIKEIHIKNPEISLKLITITTKGREFIKFIR